MYKIKEYEQKPHHFLAGSFPVLRDCGTVAEGAKILPHVPLILTDKGIGPLETKEQLDKLIGIAAAAPSENEIVFYLTGEFFTDALLVPVGIDSIQLKHAFRKLSIFLK